MSRDDDKTPARRPSALRIEKWGMVMEWLNENERRFYLGRVHPKMGHQVHVFNENGIELVETVRLDEDVSGAILRAVMQFPVGE